MNPPVWIDNGDAVPIAQRERDAWFDDILQRGSSDVCSVSFVRSGDSLMLVLFHGTRAVQAVDCKVRRVVYGNDFTVNHPARKEKK